MPEEGCADHQHFEEVVHTCGQQENLLCQIREDIKPYGMVLESSKVGILCLASAIRGGVQTAAHHSPS